MKIPAWVYWAISTATAAFTMAAFAFANFPSRLEFSRLQQQVDLLQGALDHKLERLENKLDRALKR